jgi:hypothetical protein
MQSMQNPSAFSLFVAFSASAINANIFDVTTCCTWTRSEGNNVKSISEGVYASAASFILMKLYCSGWQTQLGQVEEKFPNIWLFLTKNEWNGINGK